MNHDRIVDLLSDLRDGALDGAARAEVEAHLAACADCAARRAELDRLSAALFRRPAAPTAFQTEAFVARVMARLPAAEDPLAWLTLRWLVPAFGAAAVALLLSFRSSPLSGRADSAGLTLGAETAALASAAVDDPLGLSAEDR
ncbi:MAG: zf-HC2 domain-containing protein [Elusimicrobia bacterium]|nr:zf-HC2 domain-containing protein [Elusimicrobiota bacterium]